MQERRDSQFPWLGGRSHYFRCMIFEFALWVSMLILRYMVPLFLVICAVVLVRGLFRWRVLEERPPIVRFLVDELRESLAVHRKLCWASLLVVLSAFGVVSGRWPMWVFMAVTVLVALAMWGTFRGSFRRSNPAT